MKVDTGSATQGETGDGCVDLVCYGCGQVHPNAMIKTLPDGRRVGLQSEEWRHHCEVMAVMRFPDKVGPRSKRWTKATYLAKVRESRGDAAADKLREDMVKAWRAGK